MSAIAVSLNGETVSLLESQSLDVALEAWGYCSDKVAVARNGEFVPRSQYGVCELQPGDALDVVAPVQGG